jgi:hypothetical protein
LDEILSPLVQLEIEYEVLLRLDLLASKMRILSTDELVLYDYLMLLFPVRLEAVVLDVAAPFPLSLRGLLVIFFFQKIRHRLSLIRGEQFTRLYRCKLHLHFCMVSQRCEDLATLKVHELALHEG